MTSDIVAIAWDLETTGPDPDLARIVTSSILFIDAAGTVVDTTEHLLRVDAPIHAGATQVHGISTEYANEHGIERALAVSQIVDTLRWASVTNTPIVTFNGSYDATVLDREARRLGITTKLDEAFDQIKELRKWGTVASDALTSTGAGLRWHQ